MITILCSLSRSSSPTDCPQVRYCTLPSWALFKCILFSSSRCLLQTSPASGPPLPPLRPPHSFPPSTPSLGRKPVCDEEPPQQEALCSLHHKEAQSPLAPSLLTRPTFKFNQPDSGWLWLASLSILPAILRFF